jgi:hypothetical protein
VYIGGGLCRGLGRFLLVSALGYVLLVVAGYLLAGGA